MYNRFIIILLLSLLSIKVDGQTIIWTETFETYAGGSTTSTDNNTNDAGNDWSLTNGTVTGTFATQSSNAISGSMSFSANKADADAVNGSIWTSEVIDVSAYGSIDIGITFEEKGNLESSDFIDIEYNRDGSGWTDITGGQQSGNFSGPITITENLPNSNTIQIRVKAYTNANGEQIIFDDIYIEEITPLPVSMSDLYVKDGYLEWTTYTEINNSHFLLLASDDGITFEEMGFISGHGNSTEPIHYKQPIHGMNKKYIKLKQVDFNGDYYYTNVLVIDFEVEPKVVVMPNPNDGYFSVQIENETHEDVLLILIDSNGKKLYSKLMVKEIEHGLVGFDLKNQISDGVYYIIGTSNNSFFNKKIIVN